MSCACKNCRRLVFREDLKGWFMENSPNIFGIPLLIFVTAIVPWFPPSACNGNPMVPFVAGTFFSCLFSVVTYRNWKEKRERAK